MRIATRGWIVALALVAACGSDGGDAEMAGGDAVGADIVRSDATLPPSDVPGTPDVPTGPDAGPLPDVPTPEDVPMEPDVPMAEDAPMAEDVPMPPDISVSACPPTGPFGYEIGDMLTNIGYEDCDGNPVELHDLCGANAGLVFNFYGW